MANLNADHVFNGTFAHIWVDDEKVAEATGVSAKVELEMEDVKFCGSLVAGQKMTGIKYTGSLKLHKVSTRFQKSLGDQLKKGLLPTFTIIVKLDDPGTNGEERVVLKEVKFTDLTIMDVEVGSLMSVERPFIFQDYEWLDTVE